MTTPPRGTAARVPRVGRRLTCLVLAAALMPIVTAETQASADTVTVPAPVRNGSITVLQIIPPPGISAYSTTLTSNLQSFNQRVEALPKQVAELATDKKELTKESSTFNKKAATYDKETAAANQKAESLSARFQTLNAEIQAHNAKPNDFEIPRQAAASEAYQAKADQLNAQKTQLEGQKNAVNAEQTRLEEEQAQLSAEREQLASAMKEHNAKDQALEEQEQQLATQGQQLLQQIAEAMQSLADSPPDPAAMMDQGGDATSPLRQSAQADPGADGAGGDSPSRVSRNNALKAYAQQSGTTVDLRPGTAYLTPGAIAELPASQAVQLGSPSGTYDGLTRNSNGRYTALRVRTADAASPGQAAFDAAIARGGQATTTVDGRSGVIDRVRTVGQVPTSSASAEGTPSPSPEATCLTDPPTGSVPSGLGWILNTTESVDHSNKDIYPKDGLGDRPTQASACLTRYLGTGSDTGGKEITGWQDAQFAAKRRRVEGLARCHLIANVLGGKGQEDNLVPCWQSGMNTGTPSMRSFESHVALVVRNLLIRPGDAVYYVVTPHYRDAASTIPESVTMSATIEPAKGTPRVLFSGIPIWNVRTIRGVAVNLGN
ncbi:DNA/RNA non-specific endonuclease [Streptomyces prunicolor]|uniref:DNA/RNA non-specific endonuclease n=1 Tax=Streptomyces prunicolor TaxID=67348 RepID=UPI00371FC26C